LRLAGNEPQICRICASSFGKLKGIHMKYLPLLVLGLFATPAFADDVNVKAMPLPNATATKPPIALSCLIQPDASLNDCRLADGVKASKTDEDAAIGMVNGKGHVAGAFTAGLRTIVTVALHKGGMPLTPIR
jgi:hypothetical protein